jgi:hypothetical protein
MGADEKQDETVMSKTWLAIGVAVFALLIWWFLLR